MDILLSDRGITAGASDLNARLNELIDSLDARLEYNLIFDTGEYHLTEENSVKKVIYMTNTCGENEMKIPRRKIGIELNSRHNITLDGQGSTLIFYDRMTEFVLNNCSKITIKNFLVDFHRATVAEFTVTKVDGCTITLIPCPDSECAVEGGKLRFKALDAVKGGVVIQECDVAEQLTFRVDSMTMWNGNFFSLQISAVDNGDGSYTMKFPPIHKFREGKVYQICRILRDGCGTFISNCEDIMLSCNQYYYMHGMGILAQCSHNITIDSCNFTPNRDKGRTTTAFADMIHCSMCSGDIVVNGCKFDGARDDIVNVHGNHYKITRVYGNTIEMKYRHAQTYGFNGIKSGEIIEIIHNAYLTPIEQYEVITSEMLDTYTLKVIVKGNLSRAVRPGRLVDNYTRHANFSYTNNEAYNIPTRGLLITTHGKVTVENNLFHKMYMSAILMSDDGSAWYESGYCRDVTIENNRFIDSGTWIIDVLPEAHTVMKKPIVHKNIIVRGNYIKLSAPQLVRVRRTENFLFEGNTIEGGVGIVNNMNNINAVIKL